MSPSSPSGSDVPQVQVDSSGQLTQAPVAQELVLPQAAPATTNAGIVAEPPLATPPEPQAVAQVPVSPPPPSVPEQRGGLRKLFKRGASQPTDMPPIPQEIVTAPMQPDEVSPMTVVDESPTAATAVTPTVEVEPTVLAAPTDPEPSPSADPDETAAAARGVTAHQLHGVTPSGLTSQPSAATPTPPQQVASPAEIAQPTDTSSSSPDVLSQIASELSEPAVVTSPSPPEIVPTPVDQVAQPGNELTTNDPVMPGIDQAVAPVDPAEVPAPSQDLADVSL